MGYEKCYKFRIFFKWLLIFKYLPDISKWNLENVTRMQCLFYDCSSLLYLLDISKWNIENVTNMENIFAFCNKNLKIPSKFINYHNPLELKKKLKYKYIKY